MDDAQRMTGCLSDRRGEPVGLKGLLDLLENRKDDPDATSAALQAAIRVMEYWDPRARHEPVPGHTAIFAPAADDRFFLNPYAWLREIRTRTVDLAGVLGDMKLSWMFLLMHAGNPHIMMKRVPDTIPRVRTYLQNLTSLYTCFCLRPAPLSEQ